MLICSIDETICSIAAAMACVLLPMLRVKDRTCVALMVISLTVMTFPTVLLQLSGAMGLTGIEFPLP